MTRGFVLGKFMPPHAGHLMLCQSAAKIVDQLTILVCWLPGDPIPGPLRLAWMRELFPAARVLGHGEVVPQAPEDSPDFWPIWRRIVREAHPEPIDLVFAGEDYGARLAAEVGAVFLPSAARGEGRDRLATLSGTAVREDPWGHWDLLPPPVRKHFTRTVCLHGPESVGKTTLAGLLAIHFETIAVSEYGRRHCDVNGLELRPEDLAVIARVQAAMIDAAVPWCNRLLITDTDPLMTAAWHEMMFGAADHPWDQPKADLYLLLDIDVPWQDDGTRYYGDAAERARFMAISERALQRAQVSYVRIGGSWDQRFAAAVDTIERLGPKR